MSSSECYKCHKTGHFARECPLSDGGRGGPRGRGGFRSGRGDSRPSARVSCYNCGRSGHFARECRDQDKTCYTCGKAGHISRDCDMEDRKLSDLDSRKCYGCGKVGHISRDCPGADERKCYNCGGHGHISRECPESGSVDNDDALCYR